MVPDDLLIITSANENIIWFITLCWLIVTFAHHHVHISRLLLFLIVLSVKFCISDIVLLLLETSLLGTRCNRYHFYTLTIWDFDEFWWDWNFSFELVLAQQNSVLPKKLNPACKGGGLCVAPPQGVGCPGQAPRCCRHPKAYSRSCHWAPARFYIACVLSKFWRRCVDDIKGAYSRVQLPDAEGGSPPPACSTASPPSFLMP